MATDRDEILRRKATLEIDVKLFQDAVRDKLRNGDSGIEEICAQLNKKEKELAMAKMELRSCDPYEPDENSEQDRKAIAIIAGGRGVEIRARNDDASKYLPKKRKTYQDIKNKQNAVQSNGQHQQIYPPTSAAQTHQTA